MRFRRICTFGRGRARGRPRYREPGRGGEQFESGGDPEIRRHARLHDPG